MDTARLRPAKPNQNARTLTLSHDKLKALMDQRGLNAAELADIADVSVGTVNNALSEKNLYRANANSIAEALGVSLPVLLAESVSRPMASMVQEYLLAEVLSDWQTASNGLRYQVCRMRHTELDRQCRAKRYDFRDLPTDEQQRCRTWIKRHPVVCDRLAPHPHIVRNLTAFHDSVEGYYWVIDEWIDGPSLKQFSQLADDSPATIASILLGVAQGLMVLHENGIIRRELSPSSIYLREPSGVAVLTDFELAKLVDRGPTVSNASWPDDPYRAPEADGDDVNQQADVYSWARIGTELLLGTLPSIGGEADALSEAKAPADVCEVLIRACSPLRSNRPKGFQEIVAVVEGWYRK